MPLTPHEQRILEEIERKLAEEDPRLVQSVSRPRWPPTPSGGSGGD